MKARIGKRERRLQRYPNYGPRVRRFRPSSLNLIPVDAGCAVLDVDYRITLLVERLAEEDSMLATTREKEFRDKMAIVGVGYSRSPGVPGGFTRRSGLVYRLWPSGLRWTPATMPASTQRNWTEPFATGCKTLYGPGTC